MSLSGTPAATRLRHTASAAAAMTSAPMPRMIYGTAWKTDRTASLVSQALAAGFRGIDVACQPKHYNEPGVGEALAKVFSAGVIAREELFLQTKYTAFGGQDPARVPYDASAPVEQQVEQSLACSLRNLGVTYIDSVLLHSPLPTDELTLRAWRVLEKAVAAGTVRQLGISNTSLQQLQNLYASSSIKPAVVQQRFHSQTGFEMEMRAWCQGHGVAFQSFWTLTANNKPGQVMQSPAFLQLAASHGLTPQELCYRYVMSVGICPLNG
eukprot:COSAG05_NODE_6188_length_1004_cov_1.154696_1_plen_266_part_01